MHICLNVYKRIFTCVNVCILSLLIICRFCICEFAYSLKRICDFICEISICSAFAVIHGHVQGSEKSESLNIQLHPSCGWMRHSCSSSHNVNKCLFWGLLSTMFFAFLCFLLTISLFKMVLKRSVEVLSSAPEHKKLWRALQKENTWNNLCPGMNYSAVGHELTDNKPTIYNKCLLTETHIKQGYVSISWWKYCD